MRTPPKLFGCLVTSVRRFVSTEEGTMESVGNEEGRDEGQNETHADLQDGGEGAEGSVSTGSEQVEQVAPEGDSQDPLVLPPDNPPPQPHHDPGVVDEHSPANSVQETIARLLLPLQFSNLNTSGEMGDQDPLLEDEAEDLIVLDPEHMLTKLKVVDLERKIALVGGLDSRHHQLRMCCYSKPLVNKQQAALRRHLRRRLEMLSLDLREKLEIEKKDSQYIQEMNCDIAKKQQQLARQRKRLEDSQKAKAQAADLNRQAQEQLQATKTQYSCTANEYNTLKANVSQLQGRLEKLKQSLWFTQELGEDLSLKVKTMNNVRRKAKAERTQAEEQKLKQDLYIVQLTNDLEKLTEQKKMYDIQITAQVKETQEVKEALCEAEMVMEMNLMGRTQLVHGLNNTILRMRRQEEANSATLEALCKMESQVMVQDREIEDYKKSTVAEQERNEVLHMQLNRAQMDITASKKLIGQKQAEQEALQTHYNTCLRTLQETERHMVIFTKEMNKHQTELNDQRKQKEKLCCIRLELEDKIMGHIQQGLTLSKVAKYSQQVISKIVALKKDKTWQLQLQENEVLVVKLEIHQVEQRVENLTITREELDKETAKRDKSLTSIQTQISSLLRTIEQKQAEITYFSHKIAEIVASTGHEDMNPMQLKIKKIMAESEEVTESMRRDKQLWLKLQETLTELTKESDASSREMLKLQTEYTGMQQKEIRLDSQIESEQKEMRDLEKSFMMTQRDLVKLHTMISQRKELNQALEQENGLMETYFIHRLKDAERESIELHMKYEKMQQEKDMLLRSLVEAEQQLMLWEKHIQLVKETRAVVDEGKENLQMLKAEIHRMEVRLSQLMKEQERLVTESQRTVDRWANIMERRDTLTRNLHKKQPSEGKLYLSIQSKKRKLKETLKRVAECEQVIKELQQRQGGVSERIVQQRQQLTELCAANCKLDSDLINLQDTKEENQAKLVTLHGRIKQLKAVGAGSYKALSSSESVDSALQKQMERVHSVSTVLHQVCEESPQHQGVLHRLLVALATHTKAES